MNLLRKKRNFVDFTGTVLWIKRIIFKYRNICLDHFSVYWFLGTLWSVDPMSVHITATTRIRNSHVNNTKGWSYPNSSEYKTKAMKAWLAAYHGNFCKYVKGQHPTMKQHMKGWKEPKRAMADRVEKHTQGQKGDKTQHYCRHHWHCDIIQFAYPKALTD